MQQPVRNPIDATEKYHTITRIRNKREKNTIFNEIRQFAYIFGEKEREPY